MKIAHYASLSSLVLLLVAGVQVGALFHGWQQLDQAEQAQHQHERLQQRLTDTLQGTLRDYLSSGDPLRLAEAQTVRQLALGQLAQQDEQLTAPLRALLEKMGERIDGDYLAAGKLSGNSQWLLQNAENELTTQARALLRYGQQEPWIRVRIRPVPRLTVKGRPICWLPCRGWATCARTTWSRPAPNCWRGCNSSSPPCKSRLSNWPPCRHLACLRPPRR